MDWSTLFALLQLVWGAVSPQLKAMALAELKVMEQQASDAHKPWLVALIKEAEVLVSAALATQAAPAP